MPAGSSIARRRILPAEENEHPDPNNPPLPNHTEPRPIRDHRAESGAGKQSREIGVRMSLGASVGDVRSMVLIGPLPFVPMVGSGEPALGLTQIFHGSFRVGRHLDGHPLPDASD
jgi:hypothetical protein